MPEMRFHIRWPNGLRESCYSPSQIIKDYFVPGERYTVPEFVARSRSALTIASERVEARYGFACSRALAQLERIETLADGQRAGADATVLVEAFEG